MTTRFVLAFLLTGLPAGLACWLGISTLKPLDPLVSSALSPVLGLGAWFFGLACLAQPDALQALHAFVQLSPQLLGIMFGAAIGSITGAFIAEPGSLNSRATMAGFGGLVGASVACTVFLSRALDEALSMAPVVQ